MAYDTFDLEARLLPERIRLDLARLATVLAADQLISGLVIDNRAGFLDPTTPIDLDGPKVRPEAWESQLEESLVWFVRNEQLSQEDADTVRRLRAHALEIMAALPSFLLGIDTAVDMDLLGAAVEVLVRVDRFWGRVNVDCNPDFDGQDIADEDIVGGSSALVGLLMAAVAEA